MGGQQPGRSKAGLIALATGAIAIVLALVIFFRGPWWRWNGLLFEAGVVACLVGLGLQGRRGPGLVLIGLGSLCGFGAWFIYELIKASEAYPPEPYWPACAAAAVALGLLVGGVILLLRPWRGTRDS